MLLTVPRSYRGAVLNYQIYRCVLIYVYKFMLIFFAILIIGLAGYFCLKLFASQTFAGASFIASSVPLGIVAVAGQMAVYNLFLPAKASIWASFFIWVCFGIFCALCAYRKKIILKPSAKFFKAGHIIDLIILAGVSLLIIFLQYNQLWQLPDKSFSVGPPGSYDTIFHLIQILQMGLLKWWQLGSPYFAGDFINYPFLLNLFSGGLMQMGGGLMPAFHLPTFFLSASLVVLIWCLGKNLNFNKFSLFLLLVGTLFANNASYLIKGFPNLAEAAVRFPLEPISYQSFVFSFLLFQRTFVLGACLFLSAYIAFLMYLKSGSRQALVWASVLAGLLPFVHTHSFVAFGLMLVGAFLAALINRNAGTAVRILRVILLFGLICLPQVIILLVLPKFNAGGFPLLRLGWLSNPEQAWGIKLPGPGYGEFSAWLLLQFWNFGLMLLLPFFLLKTALAKNNYLLQAISGGGLALWIIPNLVQFQAWDYDNNKFFAYAILLSFAALLLWAGEFRSKKRLFIIGLTALIVAAALPLSVYRVYQLINFSGGGRKIIFTASEQQAAQWIKANASDSNVLITGLNQTPDSPSYLAGSMTGRSNSQGFFLWLYTHNIDFQDRTKNISGFLQNPDPKLLKSAQTPGNFLIVGPETRAGFPNIIKELNLYNYQKVFDNAEFQIYPLGK